jgi:prepilin-type N-terminal cleavage/methylation domain-containing protein
VRAIHRWESGFTLIEMMVVLTIIAILSAIATVALGTSSSRAYVTAMQADLRNVMIAQEVYIEQTFAETGTATYANKVAKLDLNLSNGVKMSMRGNANGWSARATHQRVSGTRCAVFRGTIKAFPPAADEGKITCD